MPAQKVLYFTAGAVPTGEELAAIANLEAFGESRLEVFVRNGSDQIADNGYGENNPEDTDSVAGTVPPEYSSYPVIDPDTETATVIDGSATTVEDEDATSAVASIGVTGGAVDKVTLTNGTDCIVSNGDQLVDGTGTYDITVAGGAITAIAFTPV